MSEKEQKWRNDTSGAVRRVPEKGRLASMLPWIQACRALGAEKLTPEWEVVSTSRAQLQGKLATERGPAAKSYWCQIRVLSLTQAEPVGS